MVRHRRHGLFDSDGFLHLSHSRLLDDFVLKLPGIRQMAAVGRSNEAFGEGVHLRLVTEGPDVDVDRIGDSVVVELGGFYQPRVITILPRLPLTKAGKVDKRKLRSPFR